MDGQCQFLAMPRQFESVSAFNPRTNRFEGDPAPPLAELCTRRVFRLAYEAASDTVVSKVGRVFSFPGDPGRSVYVVVSQFLVNGRPTCSVRERAGAERRLTRFGRSLGATAKTRMPATLLQRLRDGPGAYCAADGCGAALFTHAALLIVTPGTRLWHSKYRVTLSIAHT